MKTTELTIADKKYELRLTTRNIIRLEKELKKNPLSIFTGIEEDNLPSITDVVAVLWYSLAACHEGEFKDIDSVYDLYDKYIDEGGNLITLIPVLIDVFQISGIIPKESEDNEDTTGKN